MFKNGCNPYRLSGKGIKHFNYKSQNLPLLNYLPHKICSKITIIPGVEPGIDCDMRSSTWGRFVYNSPTFQLIFHPIPESLLQCGVTFYYDTNLEKPPYTPVTHLYKPP